MFQIAVYGKGGIGKSTISANISMALSSSGKKVMQVGCDPKHDSTRLLLNGNNQTTVLEYIRNTLPQDRALNDILITGKNGIMCIEAGGPEPGIGCAGRGILTTFDVLKKLGTDDIDVDFKLYDVLGDVVCGGFAVPLRNEYADAIILVTSGEFMSIYAANNIMKGILNFNTDTPRVAGLILNSRGLDNEYEVVNKFSEASGVPIVAVIPRSPLFFQSESAGITVTEMFPGSDVVGMFDEVSKRMISISEGKEQMYVPKPLDDDQMSDLAAGRPVRPSSGKIDGLSCCNGCET